MYLLIYLFRNLCLFIYLFIDLHICICDPLRENRPFTIIFENQFFLQEKSIQSSTHCSKQFFRIRVRVTVLLIYRVSRNERSGWSYSNLVVSPVSRSVRAVYFYPSSSFLLQIFS